MPVVLENGMKRPLESRGRFCAVSGRGALCKTLQLFPATLRRMHDDIVNYQSGKVTMRLDAGQEPVVRMINQRLFSLSAGDLGQPESLFDVNARPESGKWSVLLKVQAPGLARAVRAANGISPDGADYVNNITINEVSGDRTTIVLSAIPTGNEAILSEEPAQL